MSKKKGDKRRDEPETPKFPGFNPLAGGLKELKEKLEKERLAEEARKAAGKAAPKPSAPAPGQALKARPRHEIPKASAIEDELSFHRMMSGVTPLDTAAKARVPVTAEPLERRRPVDLRAKAEVEAEEVRGHLHRLVDDVARFEVSDDGRRVEGRRVDVPPSVMRSLRRGLLPIDARLDLHGMTRAEAETKIVEFLRDKRARGERCVLVIHGKGQGSPGNTESRGVLRGEMAAWLSQGRAREHVGAFATATEDDGGEGAVYVALRR